jgi:hypothetical protein
MTVARFRGEITAEIGYEPDADVVLTVDDLRAALACCKGGRNYFRRNGWSWAEFVRGGKALAEFDFFDEWVRQVYEKAAEREGRGL